MTMQISSDAPSSRYWGATADLEHVRELLKAGMAAEAAKTASVAGGVDTLIDPLDRVNISDQYPVEVFGEARIDVNSEDWERAAGRRDGVDTSLFGGQ